MATEENRVRAEDNMFNLHRNRYPGRGIVVGTSEDGKHAVQVYWIMGRSENSRNRLFSQDGSRVYTEPADPTKIADPSLIIYNAMRESQTRRHFVVSNGAQTDDVAEGFGMGRPFLESLGLYKYEPDAPNFTPRITAYHLRQWEFEKKVSAIIAVQKKSLFGDECDRAIYRYDEIAPGFGYMVTTYMGDAPQGEPLPSFRGEPILMPLKGGMESISQAYWDGLNSDNVISLAVKFIDVATGKSEIDLTNKYQKVYA